MLEPATLVSLGHGKARALGPSKEASVDSILRRCPHGQTISSFSLAPQRSGLAGRQGKDQAGQRVRASRLSVLLGAAQVHALSGYIHSRMLSLEN